MHHKASLPSAPLSTFALLAGCGAFLYAICAGFRDNYGIMLPYIVTGSGISYATVSFVIALGQLLFGAMQPAFGFLALRQGVRRTLFLGAGMMLIGLWLVPLSTNVPLLVLSLGILLPTGTAAASYGMIVGLISPQLSVRQAAVASGFVAAGIGIGICLLSPAIQAAIAAQGLTRAVALLTVPLLLLFPVCWLLTRNSQCTPTRATSDTPDYHHDPAVGTTPRLGEMLREAFAHTTYRRLTLGFFTCGFHMALIQTHLFSQLTAFGVTEQAAAWALSTYGIGVIAGGVGSGQACTRYVMSQVVAWLYASRCLWVLLLLLPLPLPALFAVIFMLGATGPATLAPTGGLVQRLFGPARLATLLGVVYLVHQVGAFCSAFAGGVCRHYSGSYTAVWYVDIAFCLAAAIACWGIREETV